MSELPKVKIDIVVGGVPGFNKTLSNISDNVDKMEKRVLQLQQKAMEKKAALYKKDSSTRMSAEEKTEAYLAKVREKSADMAVKFYAKQVAEEIKLEQQKTRGIERELAKQSAIRQRAASSIIKGVGSSVSSVASGAKNLLGSAVGVGGAFAVADALRYNLKAGSAATDAEIAAGHEVKKGQFLKLSKSPSQRLGINQSDIIGGMQAYIAKTGDAKSLDQDLVNYMADVAKSQGLETKTVGETLGQLKLQNPSMKNDEIKQIANIIIGQGKSGAVEFSDAAKTMPKALATAGKYGGDRMTVLRELGALGQIGVGPNGDVEGSATSVEHFADDTIKKEKFWTQKGMKIRSKSGGLKDPRELLKEIYTHVGSNIFEQRKLLGVHSGRLTEPLNEIYNEAEKKKKGTGTDAVLANFDKITNTMLTAEQLQEDLVLKMKDPVEQLNVVMNQLKQQVGEQVLPAFIRLVNKLPEIIEVITKLVGWIEQNPLLAAFTAAGAVVVKAAGEIALSNIAQATFTGNLGTAATSLAGFATAVGTVAAIVGSVAFVNALNNVSKAATDATAKGPAPTQENSELNRKTREEGTGAWGSVVRAAKLTYHVIPAIFSKEHQKEIEDIQARVVQAKELYYTDNLPGGMSVPDSPGKSTPTSAKTVYDFMTGKMVPADASGKPISSAATPAPSAPVNDTSDFDKVVEAARLQHEAAVKQLEAAKLNNKNSDGNDFRPFSKPAADDVGGR